MIAALLFACAEPPPPAPPDACAVMATPAPGPLDAERAATREPLALARLRVREARLTGDPGFYTLAEVALDCADLRAPGDPEAERMRAHLDVQFHRFADAERRALALTERHGGWLDWALLGDARMEQGSLDAAGEAYQRAVDLRPGLETYDRVGWLRWLWGDVAGAREMAEMAVAAGTPGDPEPYAWALTRLGWLNALADEPAPELDRALALLPDYKPARFARGRVRLFAGDRAGAAEDLRAAMPSLEAARALAEIEPVDVEAQRAQDPRGYACWLVERDPAAAKVILEEELGVRKDAMTRLALAYARHKLGEDVKEEARAALATGIVEPRALLFGGLILGDTSGVSLGPGLLPSEARHLSTTAPLPAQRGEGGRRPGEGRPK
ncbi:MAG: tetratricopeptide repeat protein [Myxococcota bacterium]